MEYSAQTSMYTSRLLFPKSIIWACSRCGIKPLASLLADYNYYLNKLRKLENKTIILSPNLSSLLSRYTYRYSCELTFEKLLRSESKLLGWLNDSTNKIPWSDLFDKYNISLDKIRMYLEIKKDSGKYIYGQDQELSQMQILDLLPTCIWKLDPEEIVQTYPLVLTQPKHMVLNQVDIDYDMDTIVSESVC